MSKSGAMELSFGMIFSILLIVFFIGFAFFAISKFINGGREVSVSLFVDDLNNAIDDMWRGTKGATPFSQSLPDKIEAVCFIDFNREANTREEAYYEFSLYEDTGWNMFFYPIGSSQVIQGYKFVNLNVTSTTARENPYCILNRDGKVSFSIEKNFGEVQPTIR